MSIKNLFRFFITLILMVGSVHGKTIRITKLDAVTLNQIISLKNKEYTIEFRKGDFIPLHFEAKGDFIETKKSLLNDLIVKRDFYIKIQEGNISLSLNGKRYKSLKKYIKGMISISTDAENHDHVPNLIKIILAAFLK
jgi:hypothetical protein